MATIVLAGVSIVVFLLTHDLARIVPFTGGSLRYAPLQNYATYGPIIAEWGEWWRVVTGTFLHADLRHLAFNMIVLYLLGRRLESSVGHSLLTGTYIVSLLGGSAVALLHRPDVPSVGASGAVYGLMGAAFVVEVLRGGNPWRDGLGSLIIVNVIISFLLPGISIGGHLGGLAAGVLAGWAIGGRRERSPRSSWRPARTLQSRRSSPSATDTATGRPALFPRETDAEIPEVLPADRPATSQYYPAPPPVQQWAMPAPARTGRSPLAVWGLLVLIAAAGFLGALAAASTWRSPLL